MKFVLMARLREYKGPNLEEVYFTLTLLRPIFSCVLPNFRLIFTNKKRSGLIIIIKGYIATK